MVNRSSKGHMVIWLVRRREEEMVMPEVEPNRTLVVGKMYKSQQRLRQRTWVVLGSTSQARGGRDTQASSAPG